MALHRMMDSSIQAPKWAMADLVCASPAQTTQVSFLFNVLPWSSNTQLCSVLSQVQTSQLQQWC
jgi:hypothetical protein